MGYSLDHTASAASELLGHLLNVLCSDCVYDVLEEPRFLLAPHHKLIGQKVPHIFRPDVLRSCHAKLSHLLHIFHCFKMPVAGAFKQQLPLHCSV